MFIRRVDVDQRVEEIVSVVGSGKDGDDAVDGQTQGQDDAPIDAEEAGPVELGRFIQVAGNGHRLICGSCEQMTLPHSQAITIHTSHR